VTELLNNNNRNLLILIMIWAGVMALTIIAVYMYYDEKIEKLEQSIDNEPIGWVRHRASMLPVRRVVKNPS